MTVRFITTRKINLLLPDEVEREIRRTIWRKPRYWVEMLFLHITFSLRFVSQAMVGGFILSLFVALYIGRLDWNTVFYVWRSFVVPVIWVGFLLLTVFCVMTERPFFKFDVYEEHFSQEIEKRYGEMLDETVTLEGLFATTQSNLSHDEAIIGSVIEGLFPLGSTFEFEYIREILKALKHNFDETYFEIVKRLLKQRGIQAEDYLGDDGEQFK